MLQSIHFLRNIAVFKIIVANNIDACNISPTKLSCIVLKILVVNYHMQYDL